METSFSGWREGRRHYLPWFVLAAIAAVVLWPFGYAWVGIPILLFACGTLLFFRDFKRDITEAPGEVLAPADGLIVGIEQLEETPHYDGPCLRISIFMSVLNVHVNRAPCDCTVREVKYAPGAYKNAMKEEASRVNESNAIWLDTQWGPVTVRQISGGHCKADCVSRQYGYNLETGTEIRHDKVWLPRRSVSASGNRGCRRAEPEIACRHNPIGKISMKLYKLKKKGERRRRFRNINVLASVMTTMNLYMGVTSILASIGHEFKWAATCILIAIIFDVLDGFVARLTKSCSDFGKELDSLCDLVSFGVAPAVLVFVAYLPPDARLPVSPQAESIVGMTGSYMAIIYVICAALRLARFNTFHADMRDSFIGLPSPAAGGTIAAFVLFLIYFEQRLDELTLGPFAYVALGPTAVVLALLMVSSVRYPKGRLKSFLLKPRSAFTALATYAFAIVIIHYAMAKSTSLVLFPLTAAYVLFGMGDTLYGWFTGRIKSYATLTDDESEYEDDSDSDDDYDESEDDTEAPSVKNVESR